MPGAKDNKPPLWVPWTELAEARRRRNLSFRQFADLTRPGFNPNAKPRLSHSYLSDLERGRREPTDNVYEVLADVLGVPPVWVRKGSSRVQYQDAA